MCSLGNELFLKQTTAMLDYLSSIDQIANEINAIQSSSKASYHGFELSVDDCEHLISN